jgi:simple sugar transport system ATP-binding protein
MSDFLRIENISKKYGDFFANEDISITIDEKSIHAIVGENGAGKSTLMNILSGIVHPTSGSIYLRGKKIILNNANDATKHKIGMVQQEFMLFDELSVIDNIIMGHEDVNKFTFLDKKKSRNKIIEICKKYNFNFPLDTRIEQLPIAIQQQVEIVKVLYKDVDIIILDEPTSVLTPQGIEGLFKAMRFLVDNGKTIIFITHKLKEVLEVSDKISILKDGKHVNTILTSETNERNLAELMVGREVFLDIERKENKESDIILNCENLTIKNDKKQIAIDNINFNIKKGEILGVVGIAGNGQVELVESLFGLRKISEGFLTYKDIDFEDVNPKKCRLSKIGYVPQDRIEIGASIFSNIIENTMMGKHLTSFFKKGIINNKETEDFANDVVKTYSVKINSLNNKAGELSGGNLQKLIVGREFLQDADLLIVEDPTRGIDIGSMEFIWSEIVNQVENKNKSVLLVSYDLNEAMSLSDRIIVLYKGKIVKEFLRKDFNENEIGFYMLGGGEYNEASY